MRRPTSSLPPGPASGRTIREHPRGSEEQEPADDGQHGRQGGVVIPGHRESRVGHEGQTGTDQRDECGNPMGFHSIDR